MDLLNMIERENLNRIKPLADRMKPTSFSTFFGQEDILGEGKLLRRLIESDRLSSIILYGPSGVGKSSLARIISNTTKGDFITLNAVTSGVKDIRDVIDRAQDNLSKFSLKTILFIDEIHRFNKSQQDALLKHVEEGVVTLIGATTENPFYEVNAALISRSNVFELKRLRENNIKDIIMKAINTDEVLLEKKISIKEDALNFLSSKVDGDARYALNVLEIAVLSQDRNMIELDDIKNSMQLRHMSYDKTGDNHYDTISAFIKSVRGSDIDASLYYLAKMLVSGEDIKFIARRLVILAAEDIGLANPHALVMANSAFDAVRKIGMPEARIILSEATIYLAKSKKSNSAYMAIDSAIDYVRNNPSSAVPNHLQDATKKKLSGETSTYLYPHDYKDSKVDQRYLPDTIQETFYHRSESDE